MVSGGSSSLLTALAKDKEEITSEAARVTWLLRAGVGSSSNSKNGFRLRTTGLSKLRYESYPSQKLDNYLEKKKPTPEAFRALTKLLDVVCLATGVLLELLLQCSSIRLEEVFYRMLGVVVLLGRL